MIDKNKLLGKIREKALTQKDVAERLGIDESTFYRKLKKDGQTFTIEEAYKISEVLDLTNQESIDIFFFALLAETPISKVKRGRYRND